MKQTGSHASGRTDHPTTPWKRLQNVKHTSWSRRIGHFRIPGRIPFSCEIVPSNRFAVKVDVGVRNMQKVVRNHIFLDWIERFIDLSRGEILSDGG